MQLNGLVNNVLTIIDPLLNALPFCIHFSTVLLKADGSLFGHLFEPTVGKLALNDHALLANKCVWVFRTMRVRAARRKFFIQKVIGAYQLAACRR